MYRVGRHRSEEIGKANGRSPKEARDRSEGQAKRDFLESCYDSLGEITKGILDRVRHRVIVRFRIVIKKLLVSFLSHSRMR